MASEEKVVMVLWVSVECHCVTLARHLIPAYSQEPSPSMTPKGSIGHLQIGPIQGFLTHSRLNLGSLLFFQAPQTHRGFS